MTLSNLLTQGLVSVAMLPDDNDFLLNEKGKQLRLELLKTQDTETYHSLPTSEKLEYIDLSKLDLLKAYTVPLIAHDYGAMTPKMWNALYSKKELNIRNVMVVGSPENTERILQVLKTDKKYLGGGAGVGFKESVIPHVTTNPADLQSVNIIVKENDELYGYNTDAKGFVISLEEKLNAIGKTIDGYNFGIFGAGGVAKEVGRLLSSMNANSIVIINRTISKAVHLANLLNQEYPSTQTYAVPEHMGRGIMLNSTVHPDALINTTDKGSDRFKDYGFYMPVDSSNETLSRGVLRYLRQLTPDVVIADIVIPSGGKESISLRWARAEGFEDSNILDGIPMVINQAGPAYKLIEDANPHIHHSKTKLDEALAIFRKSAQR